MAPVAIGLGSNVGDSLLYLRRAMALLGSQISNLRVSSVYETAPMYVEDQPPFLNAAAIGTTELGPIALLSFLKGIEREIGREARIRNGPREIDLDLIAYGVLRYRFGDRLEIPHPRIPERRFVLAPLYEIAPDLILPNMGRVEYLLGQTEGQAQDVVLKQDAVLSI